MRASRIAWLIAGALALILMLGLIDLLLSKSPGLAVKMPDGSVLRIEQIAFGKPVAFKPGGWPARLKELIATNLPARWGGRLLPSLYNKSTSSWSRNPQPIHTNQPALHIYVTRRSPNGAYQNVAVESGEIVDDDGCVFGPAQLDGKDNGLLPQATNSLTPAAAAGNTGQTGLVQLSSVGSIVTTITSASPSSGSRASVVHLAFEAFPRHEKLLHLRLYDRQHVLLSEFRLPNPAYSTVPATNWTVETLPITRDEGGLSFTLEGVGYKGNPRASSSQSFINPLEIVPQFSVHRDGVLEDGWQIYDRDLFDVSGNWAVKSSSASSVFLCPREPAWKLVLHFSGPDGSPGSTNTQWTVRGLTMPGDGEVTSLNSNFDLMGAQGSLISAAGPGEYTYSNEVMLTSLPPPAPATAGARQGNSMSSSIRGGYTSATLRMGTPYLAVKIDELPTNRWVAVIVKDDLGQLITGTTFGGRRGARGSQPTMNQARLLNTGSLPAPNFIVLNNLAPGRKVDLTFTVVRTYTEEFIFQPPPK